MKFFRKYRIDLNGQFVVHLIIDKLSQLFHLLGKSTKITIVKC